MERQRLDLVSDVQTALHAAAYRGNLEGIECLRKHGADTSIRDGLGQTPTDIAIRKGHTKAADMISVY